MVDRSLMYRFHIDPAQGFVPTRIEILLKETNELRSEATVLEMRKLDTGAFVPWRVLGASKSGDTYYTLEFAVTQFKTDYRPTADDFRIVVPESTNLQSEDAPQMRGRFKTQTSIDLTKLDELDEICLAQKR
jgi:hypothetical protein